MTGGGEGQVGGSSLVVLEVACVFVRRQQLVGACLHPCAGLARLPSVRPSVRPYMPDLRIYGIYEYCIRNLTATTDAVGRSPVG